MKLLTLLLSNVHECHVWDADWTIPEGESPIGQKHRRENVWVIGDDGEQIIQTWSSTENFTVPMWRPRSLEHILDAIEALRYSAHDGGIEETEVIRVQCEGRDNVVGMLVREASD